MKVIQKNNLNNARNAEHFNFHTNVLQTLTKEVAEAQHFGELRQTYASLFADEDVVFVQNQAYELTKEIQQKHELRSSLFLFVKSGIRISLKSPKEEKKAAAEKLDYVLEPYKTAASKPYAECTAELVNFIDEMKESTLAALLETLELTSTMELLEAANNDFNAVYVERAHKKLDRVSTANMKTIRPKVDKAYRDVASAINALYKANELTEKNAEKEEALGKIIDGVNALVLQLQQTLSYRNARTKPKTLPSLADMELPDITI